MSNEVEKSYLESQIVLLMQERAALPARFEQLKAQQEARIEAFLQEAGVLPRVKEMRAEIEQLHRKVQSHSDVLGGKIEALQAVLDTFHRLKVPAGTQFDPVSGEPLPSPAAPKVAPHDPEASGSEVYDDEDDEDDEDDGYEEADEWDEAFAQEMTGVGADDDLEEEVEDADTSEDEGVEEDSEDETDSEDDIADAIENASDEAAVRALLTRYMRKA
jgi:hypothetical protein